MLAGMGWFMRTIHADVRQNERSLAEHKTEVAGKYVTNEDLKEIKDALIRIEAAVHARRQ